MSDRIKSIAPFGLRIPPEIRRRVEVAAKKKRWSMSEWLRVAAEEKLERDLKEEVSKL